MQRRPEDILAKIDELLKSCKVSGYDKDFNDPEYINHQEQYHKITTQFNINVNNAIAKAVELIKKDSLQTFRLCSFGCGDGRLDMAVLTGIQDHFPDLIIEYTGIDLNPLSCSIAQSKLSSLGNNLSVTMLNEDVQTMTTDDIEPFDMILMMHLLCYTPSVECTLSNATAILKRNGIIYIVNSHLESLNELFYRFWLHQTGHKVMFTPSIIAALDTINSKYTVLLNESIINISQHIEDNFQLPHQRQVLDFIIHAKLNQYPPQVREECIAYLVSIADDEHLIKHETDTIIVTK